jgi:hypothetical protein
MERRVELFEETTFNYENAIRWGYYELAYDFSREDGINEQETPDFEKLKDVKVSSYEVVKSRILVNDTVAHQTVEIKYYNINTLVEKSLVHQLKWEFDSEKKKWYLRSGFPDFK